MSGLKSILEIEPICKKCGSYIEEGKPFCYECMLCDKCSPECFKEEDLK